MMRNKKGQSILEVVLAIAVVTLTLTGVVVLLSNSLNATKKGFDRKKATELARLVIEDLVAEEAQDVTTFYTLSGTVDNGINPKYSGYVYNVGFTQVTGNGCGERPGIIDCAQAVVRVGWSGSTNQEVTFTRFFSNK